MAGCYIKYSAGKWRIFEQSTDLEIPASRAENGFESYYAAEKFAEDNGITIVELA